jgi:aldose 1-epimerase
MITKTKFGEAGKLDIEMVKLTSSNGFSVSLISLGAAVQSVITPDKNGKLEDVVLGFDDPAGYLADSSYIGVICGRFANRIHNSSFEIDGKQYQVGKNEGPNCLHGGISGFNKKVWKVLEHEEGQMNAVSFSYVSVDMEEGFPGTLEAKVTYKVGNDNSLSIVYEASTSQPTYINLTNHSYFNLSGARRDILDHELMIHANQITENDRANIPTGKILSVAGTAWDFTRLKRIGMHAAEAGEGYDHNFILDKKQKDTVMAIVQDPESGRKLECITSEPAIQLYTANHFNGSQSGKRGIRYNKHYGVCLEAQHYPDSMHHPQFPQTLLLPGQLYQQSTIYRFSTI